jgi:hypothetical protein
MAKYKEPEATRYMLLDVTTVEGTSVIRIVDLLQAQFYGQILQAQGRKVMAPPLMGRGFSKLEKIQLQYLYWNTCAETPPEDYSALIQGCLTRLAALPLDDTSHEFLEKQAQAVVEAAAEAAGVKEKKEVDPLARPKATSTTGLVWSIADSLYEKAGNVFPDRKLIIDACVAEEINPSTAATQYSKWRKSKEAASKQLA